MDDSPLCQSNVCTNNYFLFIKIKLKFDTNICLLFKERVIFPKSAMNKDNEWKYVANQENFKQGIRVEICE